MPLFSLFRSFVRVIDSRLKPSNAAIHVRRGDKIQEAYFHNVAKYMELVEDFNRIQSAQNIVFNNRVYISTDDPR